jgi:hypothetical protein
MSGLPPLDLNKELLRLEDSLVEEVFGLLQAAGLNRPQMEQHTASLCSGLWNRIERRIKASPTVSRPHRQG